MHMAMGATCTWQNKGASSRSRAFSFFSLRAARAGAAGGGCSSAAHKPASVEQQHSSTTVGGMWQLLLLLGLQLAAHRGSTAVAAAATDGGADDTDPQPQPDFTVDLASPTRPWRKPYLECVGSSHMAMGLLTNNSGSGPGTAAGMGQQQHVGALWRAHLKLVREELGMAMFRGHGLFDDDVGIYQGVGRPINTAPLDSLFGFAVSIGIKPVRPRSGLISTLLLAADAVCLS